MNRGESSLLAVITDGYTETSIEDSVLGPAGVKVVTAEGRSQEEALDLMREADILLALARPLTAELISTLARCQVIARYGAGVDMVDLEEAKRRGIVVTTVPDGSVEEVASHALALTMLCARKLWAFRGQGPFAFGDPAPVHPLLRLCESCLGLVGFGKTARILARMSRGIFGRIRAFDPYVSQWDETELAVERSPDLRDLLRQADFISLHAPLTEDSRGLLSEKEFQEMKPTASLVNTARGGLIDETALAKALESGRLAGAALDVLTEEPPPEDHPLLSFPQVFYTPHLAWYSKTSGVELRRRAAEEGLRVLRGEAPRHRVV
jgi:D-3-phosphoglycerate dehydrogenase